MKPNLSTTTLIIVDCLDLKRAIRVLEHCKGQCDFAEVKLLTSLETDYEHAVKITPINSLIHYSVFCLKELYKYVDTKHMLVVQHDGWIINPQSWNPEWEQYDYMGPLFNQYDVMGVGGFSFRSRALMKSVSDKYPPFDNTDEQAHVLQSGMGFYEDGEIAMRWRSQLESEGFKFAPFHEAAQFAQGGNPNNNYHFPFPFGFHGSWRAVTLETGFVHPNVKHDGINPQLV